MSRQLEGSRRHDIQALLQCGSCAGLSDRELLERFHNGRGASAEMAFAVLVERLGPMVLRTCRAIPRNEADARDAFQVAFLVLSRKGRSIPPGTSVGGWLYGVACRTSLYARGAAARRRRHERAAASRSHEAASDPVPDDLAPMLHAEIAELPERLRSAIVFCEIEGLSGEEAARRLECPVGTVKSRLSRARKRLRKGLEGRELGTIFWTSTALTVPRGLVETTVASAMRAVSGITSGASTAALAAWETAILRAMLMSKLKASAVVLVTFGMFAAGAGMLARGQAAKREEPKAPAAATNVEVKNRDTADDLVSNLARSRVVVAKQIKDDMFRLYQGGEASLVDYLQSEKRVLDAQLDVNEDPADRIAILREHLKLSTQIENYTKQLFERDQKTRADAKLATFNRLEAALRLAEATTGRKPSARAPSKNQPIEEAGIQDLLNRFGTEQMTLAVQEILERRITIHYPTIQPRSPKS